MSLQHLCCRLIFFAVVFLRKRKPPRYSFVVVDHMYFRNSQENIFATHKLFLSFTQYTSSLQATTTIATARVDSSVDISGSDRSNSFGKRNCRE